MIDVGPCLSDSSLYFHTFLLCESRTAESSGSVLGYSTAWRLSTAENGQNALWTEYRPEYKTKCPQDIEKRHYLEIS